jgi:hypothetical protein
MAKASSKFFDPRPPGRRRKNEAELCAAFNAAHPVGTVVRVWPLSRDMTLCRVTRVASPGAFQNGAGHAVVKVAGDCIALTHVEVLDAAAVAALRSKWKAAKSRVICALHEVEGIRDGVDLECIAERILAGLVADGPFTLERPAVELVDVKRS